MLTFSEVFLVLVVSIMQRQTGLCVSTKSNELYSSTHTHVWSQCADTAREVQRLINQPELPHLTYTIFNIFNEAMQTFTSKSFYCLEPLKVLFSFLSLRNLMRVHG